MTISRDSDGIRFIGECRKGEFVAVDIECIPCGKRVNPHVEGRDISLTCSGCGVQARVFWAEDELHHYVTQHWNLLKQACSHPSVTLHG
jgi:hypothetical protein